MTTDTLRCRRCGDLIGDRGVCEPFPDDPANVERVHYSCRIEAIQQRGRLEVAAAFKLRAGAEKMLTTLRTVREYLANYADVTPEAAAAIVQQIDDAIAEATL